MPDTADVPAIRRAHDILRTLAAQPGPVKAAELMRACNLPRSSLYLLLDSLERRRWIERREGGYIVGIELMALGAAYLRHDSLQTAFHRVAAEFVARCNEVVQLAALDGFEVVYLAREDARRPVRLVSDLGLRLPAHACALGKAMLAARPPAEVADIFTNHVMASHTSRTVCSLADLESELAEARKRGYATSCGELFDGVHCVAAPVLNSLGHGNIAVSVGGPAAQMTPRRL